MMPVNSEDTETAASELLKPHMSSLPPTPLESICSEIGIAVKSTAKAMPYFELSLDNRKTSVAFIPKRTNRLHSRHMLAHLMGHICLGHAYCDHRHSYHEWQASVFATELLMPEKILIHLLYTRFHRQSDPETITELANLFKVLPQAMFVRIKEILK